MIAIFELLCYNSGMEITLSKYLRQSATYKVFSHLGVVFADFLDTLGKIAQIGFHVLRCIFKGEISKKELLLQCDRFGVSSLPITLSIVGMTSIIVASQVAHEMVKQGGGNFVGMLMTILFVPRVLSGIVMMPFVVILASVVGVLLGAVTSDMFAGLTYRAYFDSAWLGLYMKDLWVSLLKASVFGGTIALISCTCGFHATGGAKGVGIATTKAVVWSFISIVVLDMVFAVLFFF